MLPDEMPGKVKICGLTNLPDALAAAQAGADALGFVFCDQSPRRASLETPAGIIHELPPSTVKVGVFVNSTEKLVGRAIAEYGLNLLPFHGDEYPAPCFP